METSSGREQTAGTKPLCGGCEESARGCQAQGTEADGTSERTDATPPELPPPGKLKKTAFKLFGGRKSICTLPSFFGGRNKGHGKGSSKKGICKSKTHDCISEVSWEDSRRTADMSAGDFEYRGQKCSSVKILSGSQSVYSMTDTNKKADAPLSAKSECYDQKLSVDKSSSFPRPKKGLKGLFSSIRRHKKNKGLSVEIPADAVPRSPSSDSKAESELQDSFSDSNVADTLNEKDNLTDTPECSEDANLSEESLVETDANSNKALHKNKVLKDLEELVQGESADAKVDGAILCTLSEFSCAPDINPDYLDNDPPSIHSSEQISSVFGDVASLKSFDSLTGCGDIIADRDDDSIAESTMSAERSRNAGKRSSCYVTYQGGGEEMATPDEVDEDYLQGLWENEAAADVCFTPGQQQVLLDDDMDLQISPDGPALPGPCVDAANNPNVVRAVADNGHTSGDLLTPQSDQPESAPNSDEGYYDSTTPGPDEDGGDSLSRIRKERLPRDSYSGDALYELYEPDDSLMSPPLADEPSFETLPPTPDALEFLGMDVDKSLCPSFSNKAGLMEGVRQVQIEQKLMGWEVKGTKKHPTKEQVILSKDRFYAEKSTVDCNSKMNNSTHQACLKEEQVVSQTRLGKGSKVKHRNNQTHASSGEHHTNQKTNAKLLPDLDGVDVVCSTKNSHRSKDPVPLDELLQGNGRCTQSEKRERKNDTGKMKTDEALEYDQTVCFSQALVDFTNNTAFLNNLSESIGSSDSGSSFTHNMQALPAMVTFDVVDMENEGECDRQIEMDTDEDMSSPYEAYDESYLQKDAFAECDERMFELYDQNPFLGNSWGVASLPRHLNFSKMSPAMPAPLSLNRRSRSLDTDSLEFELADMYLSKVIPQLPQVSRSEWDSKKASTLHWPSDCERKGRSASSEWREVADIPNWPWQQEATCNFALPLIDGKKLGQVQSCSPLGKGRAIQHEIQRDRLDLQVEGGSPNRRLQPRTSRFACDTGAGNPIQSSRQMARPSHLPLQSDECRPQTGSNSLGTSRDSSGKVLALVSPLDERNEAYFSKISSASQYSDSSHLPVKCKPIGVTQGMPHFHSDNPDSLKPELCVGQCETSSKGRSEHEMTGPVGWNKHTALDL
ncbi:APC membrane recruitment protein 1-like [Acipenser oxyrinchus oxyrinchus]|uniref:APC membrane recruitment protein 1-like n=1 Tax=Acipenser oxyrinchus oxyrinchus TaxID=40147 RepID=A0AAD8D5R7_ACIOX|nr:APC membrane recruitment protein 1-like [Acipenser oxyrinchus oxyrinchus]